MELAEFPRGTIPTSLIGERLEEWREDARLGLAVHSLLNQRTDTYDLLTVLDALLILGRRFDEAGDDARALRASILTAPKIKET